MYIASKVPPGKWGDSCCAPGLAPVPKPPLPQCSSGARLQPCWLMSPVCETTVAHKARHSQPVLPEASLRASYSWYLCFCGLLLIIQWGAWVKSHCWVSEHRDPLDHPLPALATAGQDLRSFQGLDHLLLTQRTLNSTNEAARKWFSSSSLSTFFFFFFF